MCGIFVILFPSSCSCSELRKIALRQARTIRHRGPDWSGISAHESGAILAHERLGLVGLGNGAQPIVSACGKLILAVNGEIYNHQKIREEEFDDGAYPDYVFQTESDCEIVMALYHKYRDPALFMDKLEGMFGFVLWDDEQQKAFVGRDHIGIIPLYTATDSTGCVYIASECKAFVGMTKTEDGSARSQITSIQEFPPRCYHVYSREQPTTPEPVVYYRRKWETIDGVSPSKIADASHFEHAVQDTLSKEDLAAVQEERSATRSLIREKLSDAVHSHMMCDTPYGVLLSGGLDSSIVSALAKKFAARRIESGDTEAAWWPQVHSFAIGLPGAPDLKAAAEVAKAIGTVHHEMHFTIQEGLDAVRDVIHHIETYDVTTVRASTPMYLLARKIKAMGIKMVLSGEGADEVFGGYLYFHKAPDAKEHHAETVRKLHKLNQFDCLRANKSMAAWGVEARVPFLDKDFIDAAMTIDPQYKLIRKERKSIEKQILREAFEGFLPDSILYRQKEQFGDGVGYGWIDGVKDHTATIISDAELAAAAAKYPQNTPDSKEALWYRQMFEEHFPTTHEQGGHPDGFIGLVPQGGKSVACSTAEALEWDPTFRQRAADPSGRAVADVHGQ